MGWKSWEHAYEEGPEALARKGCLFLVVAILPLVAIVSSIFWCTGWFTETAQVAKEELNPRTLLTRYQWFKDAAAALDARGASIMVYQHRADRLSKAYAGKNKGEWSRADSEQANLWEQEVAGLKASYNNLAAEYNAAMAKINWRFCNAGDLPAGAAVALPREFRVYKEE